MSDLKLSGASANGSIAAVNLRITMQSPIVRSLSDILPFTQFYSAVRVARDGPHQWCFPLRSSPIETNPSRLHFGSGQVVYMDGLTL
jgi:hypothetical protein